jgi:hypothetical protein
MLLMDSACNLTFYTLSRASLSPDALAQFAQQ